VTSAIDAETAEAFTRKLELFEQGLSPRDQTILRAVLESAMGPWERAAARPVSEILEPEEAELLAELLAEDPDQN
jgi:hypothetical protein